MKKLLLILFSVVILSLFSTNSSYAGTFFDDFNDGNADGWWLGYSQHTPWKDGNWRVEDIGPPYEGILVQDVLGDHFIALVNDIISENQTIETHVRLNDHGSYGGVTVWFQNDNNWVDVIIYPAAGFIRVIENVNGVYDDTEYIYPHSTSTNIWYDLKVIADSSGGTLDIYLDDVYLFTHNVVTSNQIGLSGVNNGNAGAYFDNFSLTSDSIVTIPTNKDECKKGGWETFTDIIFKNQGDCVSYVISNKK